MAKDKAEPQKDICSLDTVVSQGAKGQDLSERFNKECPLETRKEVFKQLMSAPDAGISTYGTDVAKQFGNVTIVGDSARRELKDVHAASGESQRVDKPAGKKDSHQQGDRAAASSSRDNGSPGIDDQYTKAYRDAASPQERAKAEAITNAILSGRNISETVNGLGRDEKVRVMAVVKGELMEKHGARAAVSEDAGIDGARSILMQTKEGAKILLTEDKMGLPRDLIVNGKGLTSELGLRTAFGAQDLYDKAGETKGTASTGGGFNLRDALLGTNKLIEGNGPLAKSLRGENLTAQEQAELDNLAKNNRNVIVLKPKGEGTSW